MTVEPLQDDEIRAVATVNRDPIAVVCAELMRRGRMPSVSELMLGTATWSWVCRFCFVFLIYDVVDVVDVVVVVVVVVCIL